MYPVVCLQVVNLLSENERPYILAYKFDYVERIRESRPILREPGCRMHWLELCYDQITRTRSSFRLPRFVRKCSENTSLTSQRVPAQLGIREFPVCVKQPPSALPHQAAAYHLVPLSRGHLLIYKPWVPSRWGAIPCRMHWEKWRTDQTRCTGEAVFRTTWNWGGSGEMIHSGALVYFAGLMRAIHSQCNNTTFARPEFVICYSQQRVVHWEGFNFLPEMWLSPKFHYTKEIFMLFTLFTSKPRGMFAWMPPSPSHVTPWESFQAALPSKSIPETPC